MIYVWRKSLMHNYWHARFRRPVLDTLRSISSLFSKTSTVFTEKHIKQACRRRPVLDSLRSISSTSIKNANYFQENHLPRYKVDQFESINFWSWDKPWRRFMLYVALHCTLFKVNFSSEMQQNDTVFKNRHPTEMIRNRFTAPLEWNHWPMKHRRRVSKAR